MFIIYLAQALISLGLLFVPIVFVLALAEMGAEGTEGSKIATFSIIFIISLIFFFLALDGRQIFWITDAAGLYGMAKIIWSGFRKKPVKAEDPSSDTTSKSTETTEVSDDIQVQSERLEN